MRKSKIINCTRPVIFYTIYFILIILLFYPFIPLLFFKKDSSPLNTTETLDNVFSENKKMTQEDSIVIPHLEINIPVIEGDDKKSLESGAWMLPQSEHPNVSGNVIIVAHRYRLRPPSSKTFFHLDKITTKDKIELFFHGKQYIYEVCEKFETSKEDLAPLAETKEKMLTLITCSPLYSTKKRLVVKSILYKDNREHMMNENN